MGRTAPPAGASICINPITFSPVHGTVLAPIYRTERCLLRSTSRANALTIQNVPTSVQELSSKLTVLTFKLSNQITLQQPVHTTAISRTPFLGLSSRQDYMFCSEKYFYLEYLKFKNQILEIPIEYMKFKSNQISPPSTKSR